MAATKIYTDAEGNTWHFSSYDAGLSSNCGAGLITGVKMYKTPKPGTATQPQQAAAPLNWNGAVEEAPKYDASKDKSAFTLNEAYDILDKMFTPDTFAITFAGSGFRIFTDRIGGCESTDPTLDTTEAHFFPDLDRKIHQGSFTTKNLAAYIISRKIGMLIRLPPAFNAAHGDKSATVAWIWFPYPKQVVTLDVDVYLPKEFEEEVAAEAPTTPKHIHEQVPEYIKNERAVYRKANRVKKSALGA